MIGNLGTLLLLALAGVALISASPWKTHDEPAPVLPHGWGPNLGWGHGNGMGWPGHDRPAYDINPHFGFRQYSEMRYEPLVTPFSYSTNLNGPPAPTPPLAPALKIEAPYVPAAAPAAPVGPPAYGGGYAHNSLYDDGYSTK